MVMYIQIVCIELIVRPYFREREEDINNNFEKR